MQMLDNGCLKILLTGEDLACMGLTFATFDYNDSLTQEMLQTLLATAKRDTGFEPPGGVLVEAMPLNDGCLLLFTPTGGHRRIRMKRAGTPYVYRIETVDHLLALAATLENYFRCSGEAPSSVGITSLYRFGADYRLIVFSPGFLTRGVQRILQEFTVQVGEGDVAAAYITEHGEALVQNTAFLQLCEGMHTGHDQNSIQNITPAP